MTIRPRHGAWQVEVNYAKALEGYRRVRVQFQGEEVDAKAHEQAILKALEVYGKWPVEEGDRPLATSEQRKTGNLRIAAQLALDTHWKDMPSGPKVEQSIWPVVEFFEKDRKKLDIEDIDSEDMDALIKWEQVERGNSNSTINHHLSYLSTINEVAIKRKPPVCSPNAVMPIERLPVAIKEKWWLRIEDLERVTEWFRERGDALFADLIEIIAKQGFRIEEALRLEVRHFTALDTEEPWILVPGTKTEKSQGSIPLFDFARPVVDRCLERAKRNRWKTLFPMTLRQARERWLLAREFLGVSHIPTSTMRALRRTFAAYANGVDMTTRNIQKVLRHSTIVTTEGYLQLTGSNELEGARNSMKKIGTVVTILPEAHANDNSLAASIAAYRASGATPAEVAQFVKEMMK